MAPAAHALLSISGSERWLHCTPSVRLAEGIPDSGSKAADEGTEAHALSELETLRALERIPADTYIFSRDQFTDNAEYYDTDMQRHAENYAEYALALVSDLEADYGTYNARVEHRVDLSDYIPKGFGTSDFFAWASERLIVLDLKYGKGVEVSAVENSQLMLYALGALLAIRKEDPEAAKKLKTVDMHIFQPRIDNYSTWSIKVVDLVLWAQTVVKPQAKKAWAGEGEQVVGEYCRFCKVAGKCRAFAERNLALARNDFKQAEFLTVEEMAEVLEKIDLLVPWANAVKQYALTQAMNGVKIPRYKVVIGRSNRQYADEKAIIELLEALGHEETEIYKKKIIGLGDLEKLLGKKYVATVLDGLIVKPPGAPTLVPVTDTRPDEKNAAAEFAEFLE